MPRVYPQRVLDLIENELYEEFEDLEESEEEAVLNSIEDEQREKENAAEERAERAHLRSLSVPAGVTFDPVLHLDNLPPLRDNTGYAANNDGLDNLPSTPLFQGRRWPFL